MKPTLVRYEAPGWGIGEVWLEGDARRLVGAAAATARPASRDGLRDVSELVRRLQAFFAGEADDVRRRRAELEDGFYGDCARALRAVPRGEVVTYGELAALAGRPGAARAAGHVLRPQPSCRRSSRAIASSAPAGSARTATSGIGYKRRLLALEDVAL